MKGDELQDKSDQTQYNPSHEWPGSPSNLDDNAYAHISPASSSSLKIDSLPSLRLLVRRTAILPSKHKLALCDGYTELQFGRDLALPGGSTPRIRLKEMDVSRLHAAIYWDRQKAEWAVVDMGSKHGTFLAAAAHFEELDTKEQANFVRLSPPKFASIPRKLQHLDLLTIGSTSFSVHIHEDCVPCIDCSTRGGDEIPLFSHRKTCQGKEKVSLSSTKRSRDAAGLDSRGNSPQDVRDPKKALSILRQNLLSQHSSSSTQPGLPLHYKDRPARRRALHAASSSDAPGVSSVHSHLAVLPKPSVASRSPSPHSTAAPTVMSQTPAPLPTSNIGHQLLVKQGWEPGTSLRPFKNYSEGGTNGLIQPLEIAATTGRAGLGMPGRATPITGCDVAINWKESARYKRWDDLQSNRLCGG